MRRSHADPRYVLPLLLLVGPPVSDRAGGQQPALPPCRPIDSAWAIQLRIVDATTRLPVRDVGIWSGMSGARTDSLGFACLRDRAESPDTLHLWRRGYVEQEVEVRGRAGELVVRAIDFRRVAPPCCDLRGEWDLRLQLDTPGRMHPRPAARTTSGVVRLGPRILAPEEGDDLDSLVRPVRGLHEVDLSPFFGGPYATDVSTTVFGGSGGRETLFKEVEALIAAGDSVEITIIPRMSHGGLSLTGRIRGDSIQGTWFQNAYCCGAVGRFVMIRTAAADTARYTGPVTPSPFGRAAARPAFPPATVEAGTVPPGRWRPAFEVSGSGALWLAIGGLFVADSFGGEWRRALGGPEDPVEQDELRIQIAIATVGTDIVLLGLEDRYPVSNAPTLYRSADRGRTWASVPLPGVSDVSTIAAHDSSVWLVGEPDRSDAAILLRSADAGATWSRGTLPGRVRGALRLHRESERVAYLTTSAADGAPALWRTLDGGETWRPVSTPADQHLHRVEDHETRIEELARVGDHLVVREHGRVFASPVGEIKWRALPDYARAASGPLGDVLFVIRSDGRPALLDRELRAIWTSDWTLDAASKADFEHVRWAAGAGYMVTSGGTLFQVRDGRVRRVGR